MLDRTRVQRHFGAVTSRIAAECHQKSAKGQGLCTNSAPRGTYECCLSCTVGLAWRTFLLTFLIAQTKALLFFIWGHLRLVICKIPVQCDESLPLLRFQAACDDRYLIFLSATVHCESLWAVQ